MITPLIQDETDDPAFLELVSDVVEGVHAEFDPQDVFFIKIKNWFDLKWLGYSGYTVDSFPRRGVNPRESFPPWVSNGSAIYESYQKKITFPPFNPKRVVSQDWYSDDDSAKKNSIHSRRWRGSRNLNRRVVDYSHSALFFWYSSGSKVNGQSSLMVYRVEGDVVETWYASLVRSDACDWKVNRIKGLSLASFEALARAGAKVNATGLTQNPCGVGRKRKGVRTS